ncbi:MAG TPA: hypothetical protein VJT15_21240 [Pyrinomonadaceae bacterium]|nr:hypothetical protein [Pyrinomonadaceae bacterium]
MKCFLSTSAFVAAVVLLLVLAPDRSLTAETNAIPTSANEPIKVLGVKLTTAKPKTIDSLEVEVQNTSTQSIQYLVIHAEIPGKFPIRVPVAFGSAPVPTSNAKIELLQPGAKTTLIASKNLCERLTKDLASLERIPASDKIQATINVAVYADRSAWADGEMHYPDPNSGWRWLAASELARTNDSQAEKILGVKFSKANYKAESSKGTCYRRSGFEFEPCCDNLLVKNFFFIADPNGNVQPVPEETCCSPGNCCETVGVRPCSQ